MSISSEISRISQNISDSLDAVAAKGVSVPVGSTSDDLPDLIAQITGGGGTSWETEYSGQVGIQDWGEELYYVQIQNYFPAHDDFVYGETYRVTWNGYPYICDVQEQMDYYGSGSYYCIGNATLGGGSTGNNEPFFAQRWGSDLMFATTDSSGTFTLTIEKQVGGGGGGSVLVPKTIVANGTYDPADDNADGYSEVTVNVHGGLINILNGSGTDTYRGITVTNTNGFVVFNGNNSAGAARFKISGTMAHAVSKQAAWAEERLTGITVGRKYVLVMSILSGTFSTEIDTNPAISIQDSNNQTTAYVQIASHGNFSYGTFVSEPFVATANNCAWVMAYFGDEVTMSNLTVRIILIDVDMCIPIMQAKTNIDPTASSQIIQADSAYDGLSYVQINAIPNQYIIPSGNKDIKVNGSIIDVSQYSTVSVNTVPETGYTEDLTEECTSIFQNSYRINAITGAKQGGTSTYADVQCTNGFIDIERFDKIILTVRYVKGSTNASGLAFYSDTNDNSFISGEQSPYDPNIEESTYQIVTVPVPTGAKYIRTTWWSETGADDQFAEHEFVMLGHSETGGSTPQPTLQAKTNISPTESSQTIQPDSGYDGLSSVQINAVSSSYVGSGITRRSSTDLTASGATVTVPSGYYESQATKSIVSGTVTAPSTISGTSATVSTGTNTLTLTKTVSVTPNVSTAGYISSGAAGNSSVSLTANVTTKAAATITPSTSNQTIAAGTYLTGAQTISGDANLVATNIAQGVTIFGILGTHAGGSSGIGTLLNTTSIGTVSTTSTNAGNTNVSLSVSNINNYDLLIVETSVDTVTNNRHTATVGVIFLTASSAVGTKNGATIATAKWNSKASSNGTTTTNVSTTAYGIYPNSCSISNGTATIPMYRRYNSTSTGTINGTYTARVYGVNLYDLIGG